jgi:hypothetical protein
VRKPHNSRSGGFRREFGFWLIQPCLQSWLAPLGRKTPFLDVICRAPNMYGSPLWRLISRKLERQEEFRSHRHRLTSSRFRSTKVFPNTKLPIWSACENSPRKRPCSGFPRPDTFIGRKKQEPFPKEYPE